MTALRLLQGGQAFGDARLAPAEALDQAAPRKTEPRNLRHCGRIEGGRSCHTVLYAKIVCFIMFNGEQDPPRLGIRYYGIGFWLSPERHLTALVLRGAPKRYYGIGFSLSPERYLTALVLRGAERYGTA